MTEAPGLPEAAGMVPRPRAGTARVELDGETFLYDGRMRDVHVLNATAALVWSEFDGTRTLGEIADELGRRFQVDAAAMRRDLLALAGGLVNAGVLDLGSNGGSEPDRDRTSTDAAPASEHRFLQDPPGG